MSNELKQYIDLYLEHNEVINSHSADALNALRPAAFEALKSATLPALGSENHHITDLPAMLAPDYGVNINRVGMHANASMAFRCDVPNLRSHLCFLVNDTFHSANHPDPSIPEGVIIGSLNKAATQHPELISKYYGKIAPLNNPKVALNTLLAQDGIFIYIPRNVAMQHPIQVVSILNNSMPLMATRRILVVAEAGSQCNIVLCDHTQSAEVLMLTNQVVEVWAHNNASINIYDMEESSALTRRISSVYVNQDSDSSATVNTITLMNGITRNDVNVNINGTGCDTHLYGVCIGRENESIDNHTHIAHNAPRCHSRELYKYLLDGNSRGAFGGKIYVSPGADKVEAYQSNNNIIASDKAKMFTKPQLEIYTDDVKCSHGASTGQLDQNALFYMRSRGIPEDEGKTLLMQAFMDEVVSTVKIDALRDRLKILVEKRLNGTLALCGDCGVTCLHK